MIEELFATEPAEHWLDLLLAAGIPAGKVRSMDDVYAWDQVLSQGLVLDVDHPAYGIVAAVGLAAAVRRQRLLGWARDARCAAAARRALRRDPSLARGVSQAHSATRSTRSATESTTLVGL